MGTIADKLELLRRTKERQKAYLQQKYPLLDFDNIPFRRVDALEWAEAQVK